jgi:pantoate--beta-alanine ligase
MDRATTVAELRARVRAWRHAGERVGFVPTMGNLHAGHLALVDAAREVCARVVTSVFVNPTQFGPNEDFASYPRTLEEDAALLEARGCDLVFAPTVEAMYPRGTRDHVEVRVPGLTDELCGASRPGHFTGVATVVTKLLNVVAPDVAVFGQKDYQQLLVVRQLVADLALPVDILAVPTVREANGLAMSSRNRYLSAEQRETAGAIYATLRAMAAQVAQGLPIAAIEADGLRRLTEAGLAPDYVALRHADDLSRPADGERRNLVALIAARLGPARLIDNLLIGKDIIAP